MLLHNGNLFGAIPIGPSVYLKEKHEHIKVVLDLLKYDDHKCVMCGTENGKLFTWATRRVYKVSMFLVLME